MKKLICLLLCVATVFVFSTTVFAGAAVKSSGDISISFYEKGDVNRDKKIDKKDSEQLLKYAAGWNMNVTIRKSEADVNRDGAVDGLDALQLLQQVAGLK